MRSSDFSAVLLLLAVVKIECAGRHRTSRPICLEHSAVTSLSMSIIRCTRSFKYLTRAGMFLRPPGGLPNDIVAPLKGEKAELIETVADTVASSRLVGGFKDELPSTVRSTVWELVPIDSSRISLSRPMTLTSLKKGSLSDRMCLCIKAAAILTTDEDSTLLRFAGPSSPPTTSSSSWLSTISAGDLSFDAYIGLVPSSKPDSVSTKYSAHIE